MLTEVPSPVGGGGRKGGVLYRNMDTSFVRLENNALRTYFRGIVFNLEFGSQLYIRNYHDENSFWKKVYHPGISIDYI